MDLMIYESGNGGDLLLKGGDVQTTEAIYNGVYLAHFGGNVEASTTGDEQEGVDRLDWWGNQFLDEQAQMNSELERAINSVALTSGGRVTLEKAAKKDIDYLSDIAETTVTAEITGNNKIKIIDKINQTAVNFIWDATKNEVIEEITI
jgi:phage gp46-like protein